MYRTVKLFEDTGDVNDRKRSGRPRAVRTPQVINAVRSRIARKPVRKQKIMAQEMSIAPRTMSRIIKQDLGLGAFKRQTGQRLTFDLKKIGRKNRSSCYPYTVVVGTKKFCLPMKKFFRLKKSLINKTIRCMHDPLRKPGN